MDKQRDCEVGYCKPPREHQFKPGQSGNPAGPPPHRTQAWTYVCKYMGMDDAQLARLDRSKLPVAAQLVLRAIEDAMAGKSSTLQRFLEYCIDRDEGKAVQMQVVAAEDKLPEYSTNVIRPWIGYVRGIIQTA